MEPTYKKFHEGIALDLHRNAANSVGFQANTQYVQVELTEGRKAQVTSFSSNLSILLESLEVNQVKQLQI